MEVSNNSVKFTRDNDSYLTVTDEKINFSKAGVKVNDLIQISNTKNPGNNSGMSLNKIKMVNNNVLIFDDSELFENEEPGANVVIKIFDANYGNDEDIEQFNKNNITIVIPDINLYSYNYDYKYAHYKGCQFVALNYQNADSYMKKYFKQFQEKSFKFKPDVLVNEIELPKAVSLNSMIPKKKLKPEYEIDNEYFAKIGKG